MIGSDQLLRAYIRRVRGVSGARIVSLYLPGPVACFARPVLLLKKRIQVAKRKELAIVHQGIRELEAEPNYAPDAMTLLLTRQLFIESRWEWPIAGHVQKLIIFGLLPPASWVLAAVIENSLY